MSIKFFVVFVSIFVSLLLVRYGWYFKSLPSYKKLMEDFVDKKLKDPWDVKIFIFLIAWVFLIYPEFFFMTIDMIGDKFYSAFTRVSAFLLFIFGMVSLITWIILAFALPAELFAV